MSFNSIGVIGAGTIGIGVAADLVIHDYDVVLVDVSPEVLDQALAEIEKAVRFLPLFKKPAPAVTPAEALTRLKVTTDLHDVDSCDFIVENVTEKWEIKEKLYRELDQICQPPVCFGVNTSCISITRIAGLTKRPDKIVGIHFMNPVYLKTGVEIMRGYHTSEETLDKALAMLKNLEKEAIVVNDFPGFVSNRLSHLFMNEAAFLIQERVATAQEVDNIFKKCFGHKMGPLETADLIGLDTVADSLAVLYQSYQDPKFRCCPLLRKMVDAGLKGRKSGEGFYKYNKQGVSQR